MEGKSKKIFRVYELIFFWVELIQRGGWKLKTKAIWFEIFNGKLIM